MTTKLIEFDDMQVTFEDNKKVRDMVFERVLEFFIEHRAFHGESICQRDDPQIYAPSAFAEIADDIIKFNVEYTD